MTDLKEFHNPFAVQSPEDMTALDTYHLFVYVFNDFPKIPLPGHSFLHGPRGSGKSMMFRYLMPDCQQLVNECSLSELPFYSVYVPLKNTDLKLTELMRLEDKHASTFINEHFMVMYIASKLFSYLSKADNIVDHEKTYLDEIKILFENEFIRLLHNCGWESMSNQLSEFVDLKTCFTEMGNICDNIFNQVISYLKTLSFRTAPALYEGPLCGYLDFLYPLLCKIRKLSFMPDGPIYLLIDDADNLNLTQTMVLNTWVSTRTSSNVSIKVSTQLQYKTLRTMTGQNIETPHDYSEVNISTIYTSSRINKYRDRIHEIVSKRLTTLADIDLPPEEFFPEDQEQEEKIRNVAEQYKREWETSGRGYRPRDDALRYARPDYMKSLAGTSKSSYSYSYAGFDQLVHISSGIVRYFLDAAAVMYSEEVSNKGTNNIEMISPAIQDRVVRQQANDFLFTEFEKMFDDKSEEAPDHRLLRKLYNLIKALGGVFRQILLSERSERRVFSIAFSSQPSSEIIEILKSGIMLGYFHVSSIGNKDGTGRTRLYILSRRLSPYFNLDPSGFAGYLFVTPETVELAMGKPDTLLRRVKSQGIWKVFEEEQLQLFD